MHSGRSLRAGFEQDIDSRERTVPLFLFLCYTVSIHSMSLHDIQSELTKEQKTGFVLLLFFAIATVALGFLQLRNTIYSPFALTLTKNEKAATLQDEATRLQSIDTDRDGINDYDEINFYQTSAYLPDTDSDGKTDKQEIDAKTDPLCPQGQKCEETNAPENTELEASLYQRAAASPTPVDITGSMAGAPGVTSTAAGGFDVEALLKDPQKLRTYLVTTGKITEDQLKNIDDASLLAAFQSEYAKLNTASSTPTQP